MIFSKLQVSLQSMKATVFLLCFVIVLGSCHHRWREAYNPYLHSKHKPSEDIRGGFVKQDKKFRKKKNWFFFRKK
jgi:hypothetical protein